MDATKGLRLIAEALQIKIPSPGEDAGILTGKILMKLNDTPTARLNRRMMDRCEAISDCHDNGQDADESMTTLGETLSAWRRSTYNIEKYGQETVPPPATP